MPGDYYDKTGKYPDPTNSGVSQLLAPYADFYPGEFSRTHVGATSRTHSAVAAGLRAGRVWVSHGGLVDSLEVAAFGNGDMAGLGSRLRVRRGSSVTVVIAARLASHPNSGGSIPRLRRLDLIQGPVTGPATPDAASSPGVHVAESFEPRWWPGHTVLFQHTFRNVRAPFYARLRGTDGNRHTSGGLDPIPDVIGDSNPFEDLWCYTNPIFVDVS
jgi:hypothetical protein